MKPCRTALLILATTAAGAEPGWCQDVFSESLGPRTTYGTTSVAVDPRNPEVLFAGSDADGLFVSRDGGANWQAVWSQGIEYIEIDPGNPDVVYAAGDRIIRSLDGGRTWSAASWGPLPWVRSLKANPHLPGVVYAGLGDGILRSTDYGETWHRILSGTDLPEEDRGVWAMSVDPWDAGTIYAAGSGLRRSTDGGDSWEAIENGIPFDEVRKSEKWGELLVTALAADPEESGVVTAGITQFPRETPGRIYRSTDGGASWRLISEVGSWLTALFIDPVHPTTILVGTGAKRSLSGTFLSTDGGLSWGQIQGGGARQIVASPGEAGTYFTAMRAGETRGVVRISIGTTTAIGSTGWGSLKALTAPPSPSR